MSAINIQITGMPCDRCAKCAEDALNALPGVKASVSYADSLAEVEITGQVEHGQLLKAVASKGYGAQLIDEDDTAVTGGNGDRLQVAIIGTGSGAFAAAIKTVEEGAHAPIAV